MSHREPEDLSSLSMLELFHVEAETQAAIINSGLLELEQNPDKAPQLEALMRAAHSLKGAARIVNQEAAVSVAHAMEDCFVAAQEGRIQLRHEEIDVLLQGVDLLLHLARHSGPEVNEWESGNVPRIQNFLTAIGRVTHTGAATKPELPQPDPPVVSALVPRKTDAPAGKTPRSDLSPRKKDNSERLLRLQADNLNRLLGLAGESLVESRWLGPFSGSMLRLKRTQTELQQSVHALREMFQTQDAPGQVEEQLDAIAAKAAECSRYLSDRLAELETHDRRSSNLSNRLYLEVLQCRMRPFGEGVRRFPRMVRDLARSLGKKIRLEVVGEHTQVDRDILDRLDAPLTHLLRNAVDHGCEPPEERRRTGKPEECVVRVEARHSAGMLMITVADDGVGIHPDQLRDKVVQKRLTTRNYVEKMSEGELLEFLLLPGFTMRNTVTELSGRGVGLDVVQNMVKGVRGAIRMATQPGRGMRFQLQLPITLSVVRTLLIEVSGEPYAVPLSQITRTLKLPRDKIEVLENCDHFVLEGKPVSLLTAHQVLGSGEPSALGGELPVMVMGDRNARYGLVVDRFLGERELVLQPLDPRLGKIQNISSGSLMEDGSPVLVLDVEDMLVSIEKLAASGRLDKVQKSGGLSDRPGKRVLVVDDSLTVRELQRKLLSKHGYVTDVAVDGMDGWNAVRNGNYDLVITDVDMPRMDGIELATLIKKEPKLSATPVMIVSYKDREEDRLRGLEAGADYYLTKGSFHDETLLQAVADLIGSADA